MAKLRTIQILRGTTAQNNSYTGSAGELTMDTTTNELRVHDGSTAGGHKIGTKIDNLTITENASQEIQAVATVNANIATGATNPIYDWVGTLAEYQAQNIETNHPDWVCYITDDFSAQTYDAYSKGQSDNLFVTKGHQVIEFQEPTSANGYTWYRLYADGWVEQGGGIANNSTTTTVTLPVAMANTNYTLVGGLLNGTSSATYEHMNFNTLTTTSFNFTTYDSYGVRWQVSGMAA